MDTYVLSLLRCHVGIFRHAVEWDFGLARLVKDGKVAMSEDLMSSRFSARGPGGCFYVFPNPAFQALMVCDHREGHGAYQSGPADEAGYKGVGLFVSRRPVPL